MKIPLPALCLFLLLAAVPSAGAVEPVEKGVECPPGTGQAEGSSGICTDAGQTIMPFTQPGAGILQPLPGPQKSAPGALPGAVTAST